VAEQDESHAIRHFFGQRGEQRFVFRAGQLVHVVEHEHAAFA
jgi:hypothetical protein